MPGRDSIKVSFKSVQLDLDKRFQSFPIALSKSLILEMITKSKIKKIGLARKRRANPELSSHLF